MKCSDCNTQMELLFNTLSLNEGKYQWKCIDPQCLKTQDYVTVYPELYSTKYMGWAFYNRLKKADSTEKEILLIDIKVNMLRILNHYVNCRVGACYTSILKYILIEYLSESKVLDLFLKGPQIELRSNAIMSPSGSKIYYDLYYDFMLVKNHNIKEYLKKEFPEYYHKFITRVLPSEQYNFIDYNTNRIIDNED